MQNKKVKVLYDQNVQNKFGKHLHNFVYPINTACWEICGHVSEDDDESHQHVEGSRGRDTSAALGRLEFVSFLFLSMEKMSRWQLRRQLSVQT